MPSELEKEKNKQTPKTLTGECGLLFFFPFKKTKKTLCGTRNQSTQDGGLKLGLTSEENNDSMGYLIHHSFWCP